MTAGVPLIATAFDWEAAGRELGAKLDRLHSVAVLGSNENDTARVALGIARQQSSKRRVAIGDLIGDVEPIQSLIASDDHHGLADVFEYEASGVRLGQPATLTLDYLPGRVFRGRVSYILPQVDPNTRTLKVRIQLDNPGYVLKPEMYGQVELATGGARKLMVPQTALGSDARVPPCVYSALHEPMNDA